MTRGFRIGLATAGALCALGIGAAIKPGGLASAWPGLWEISRSATGVNPQRVCLADLGFLARWEHRRASCSVTKLTEKANLETFDYQCGAGGFGRTDITLLTPRSLRIRTQGISNGLPFDETLQARWVRQCNGVKPVLTQYR